MPRISIRIQVPRNAVVLLAGFLLLGVVDGPPRHLRAQNLDPNDASLRALSDGFETLAERATPAVVQIVTSGYGPIEDGNPFAATVARQRGGGSGVILDPNGYIVTNAHVVDGAKCYWHHAAKATRSRARS